MGPDKNKELFEAFGAAAVPSIIAENETRARIGETLEALSTELNRQPLRAVVSESTLPIKLFALGQLRNHPMGISGNPLEFMTIDEDGLRVSASVVRPHDSFDGPGGTTICSRAVLFLPPDSYHTGDSDLEVFGINLFMAEDDTLKDPDAASGLITLVGEVSVRDSRQPMRGVTNIFVMRSKAHGMIRCYSVTVGLSGIRPSMNIESISEKEVSVHMPDGTMIKLTELTGSQFVQVADEFANALDVTRTHVAFDQGHALTQEEKDIVASMRATEKNNT